MSQTEDKLMREISMCGLCSRCGSPFHFHMHGQKVMIISAMPSLQAEYKTLLSIRFFRRLCVALFGDKYLREKELCDSYIREFCEGNIYWTHYRKCYSKEYACRLADIDSSCADKYLKREIQAIVPEIIIVFGDEIKEKVSPILRNFPTKIIYKPFPKRGDEAVFNEVRNAIAPKLKYVKKTGLANNGVLIDDSSELEGHAVHLQFERETFMQLWKSAEVLGAEHTLDEFWQRYIVTPNTMRGYKLMMTYTFCENQIKTLLYDYFSATENYTILSGIKDYAAAESPTPEFVREYIRQYWLSALIDYTRYERPDSISDVQNLCRKLKVIRLYRNALAHNGGRILPYITSNLSMADPAECVMPGIMRLGGFVWISEEGETSLTSLIDETTALLCKIQ